MKKVVTLLSLNTLLLLSSCSSGITKIEAEELFTYSNDIIMPIEDGERMILSGYVIYNQNETLNNVRLFERTYILYEGEYISFASGWINGTVAEVHKNDVIPYSFIVPESDNSASYGLKVELSVRNFDTQEYYDTRTLKVVTKLHTYINPEEYRLFPLTINRLTRGDGKEVEESFLFNNIMRL